MSTAAAVGARACSRMHVGCRCGMPCPAPERGVQRDAACRWGAPCPRPAQGGAAIIPNKCIDRIPNTFLDTAKLPERNQLKNVVVLESIGKLISGLEASNINNECMDRIQKGSLDPRKSQDQMGWCFGELWEARFGLDSLPISATSA